MIKALTLVSAIGSGLAAGVFFAFSTFVMKALGDLPPAQGVAAMQSMNKYAPTPWFMSLLFGTAVTAIVVAIGSFRGPGGAYAVAGCLLYLIAIVLTIVYHVPRNNELDAVTPGTAEAARLWSTYLSHWTAWNHLRVLGPLAASVCFAFAWRSGS